MNKLLLTVLLIVLPVSSFAAQQQLQTRANTTSPSVDTNFTRQQAMNTDLYTNKADKSSTIVEWSTWPNGTQFVANAIVSYQGTLYKCLQPYTKNSGDSPAAFTAYWSVTGGGGVTSYAALTDKPTIPDSLADLSADSTHRVVTDAEKSAWNAKQAPLTAGTDYLAPTGSAAGLTNFPATLATDSEVTTAVAGKANTSAFASSAAFQAAYGWSPSGTFDTAASQTITGNWAFSSGLEASNISLNLGTLADLKIGNAQMVDDTKGNGDTNFLWSADKTFDQLATKQATLVSGTNIKTINGNSLVGSGDLTVSGGTGTSGYVSLPAAPYSDVACTTGQYGYYGSTAYLCTGGFWASKWTLTAHSNPSPVTYSLTITPASFTGADKFTYNSTDYATQQVITGLSADASFTVTPDTGRAITCAGTGLTDNTGGSYTANTDTASVVAICTSSSVSGGSDTFTGTTNTLLATHNSAWVSTASPFVVGTVKILATNNVGVSGYDSGGAYYSTSTSDTSQIVFKAQAAYMTERFLAVRMGSASLGYSVQFGFAGASTYGECTFKKNGTPIHNPSLSIPMTWGADHTVTLSASGSSSVILVLKVDGTQVATYTDSTSTIASGSPGFYIAGNGTDANNLLDTWQDHE